MLFRVFTVTGIVLALLGFIVVQEVSTRKARRGNLAIHRFHPDDGFIPWDLTGFVPTGWVEKKEDIEEKEWGWSPELEIVDGG